MCRVWCSEGGSSRRENRSVYTQPWAGVDLSSLCVRCCRIFVIDLSGVRSKFAQLHPVLDLRKRRCTCCRGSGLRVTVKVFWPTTSTFLVLEEGWSELLQVHGANQPEIFVDVTTGKLSKTRCWLSLWWQSFFFHTHARSQEDSVRMFTVVVHFFLFLQQLIAAKKAEHFQLYALRL